MVRRSEEASLWDKAYEREEHRHRELQTFQYLDANEAPKEELIEPAVVTFTYKHAPDGTVLDYKQALLPWKTYRSRYALQPRGYFSVNRRPKRRQDPASHYLTTNTGSKALRFRKSVPL